jgi:hypothetical protein
MLSFVTLLASHSAGLRASGAFLTRKEANWRANLAITIASVAAAAVSAAAVALVTFYMKP